MANIKNMNMAKTLLADGKIEFTKSFFGLCTTATYKPTGSRLKGYQNEYSLDQAWAIKSIIGATPGKLSEETTKTSVITPSPNGPIRLEICMADDQSFAAIQMMRFEDFDYQPTSEVKTFEGDDVKALAKVLL
jgi:hypothetical protein